MPCVNYVKEHIAFIEYAADNNLRPNEILVWEALFHVMNQRANGNYWPDGFIRVKNDRLLTYAPIGFDSLSRARNTLAQRGLIGYKPGKKNSEVPMYELHYLTAVSNPQLHDGPVDNPVDSSFYPVVYPQIADNIGGNIGDNIGGNLVGNVGGKLSHQYIKPKQEETQQRETYIDDDDEDDDVNTRGRARAYERCFGQEVDEYAEETAELNVLKDTAVKAFKMYFGREATAAEAQSVARMAHAHKFGPDLLAAGLKKAARMNARIPAAYLSRIFEDWSAYAVQTVDEADEYEFLADASAGRNMYGSGDVVEDYRRLHEFREENKRRHGKTADESGGC